MDIIDRFRAIRKEKKTRDKIPVLNDKIKMPLDKKNASESSGTCTPSKKQQSRHDTRQNTDLTWRRLHPPGDLDLPPPPANNRTIKILGATPQQATPRENTTRSPASRTLKIQDTTYALRAMASGGMCDVFRANGRSEDAPVLTVKILKPQWVASAQVRRQFAYEAQILKGLNAPFLPTFFHMGQTATGNYLAYHYIPGSPLISLAQRKKFYGQRQCLKRVIQLMLNVLDQVQYLHTKPDPIVHGDISAENVLISPKGTAHLVDFGCAHLKHVAPENAAQWIGKPSYLSPEQARGQAWSAASDVYQLGILLYELVVGKRWVRGKSPEEKRRYAASVRSPAPQFLADMVPASLSAWIADCLQAESGKRPIDVAELTKRLYRIHADL